MPKIEFTQEEIDGYLKGRVKHHFYDQTVKIAEAMAVHADGITPKELMEERRPNEPQEVLDYRIKIFTPKTKPAFSKILSSLQKIRRSADWSIRFEGEFSKVRPEDSLETYTTLEYPYFTSITNWVFSLLLRKYLIDPNAVVLVAPITRDIPVNEYLQPIASIFNSADVIDYVEEDYCVLVNPEGAVYYSGGKPVIGASYFIVTTQQILRYDQVNGRGTMALADQYDHGIGYLPAFKLRGTLIDQVKNQFLYESKIAGIIPELDEAIREYSDLQAAKVLHIYPERWEYTNHECTSCKGKGLIESIKDGLPCSVTCDTCKGRAYVVSGPYSKIVVKPSNTGMGEAPMPTPPAGYVEKDVEIVKIMETSIDAHIHAAYSAINFEFLDKSPLSQSGVAKEVDKDELNNMVHAIAEDIVAVMDQIHRFIAYYRYGTLYSLDEIHEMVPAIAVPEKFDILSSTHTLDEMKTAKEGNANPVIQSALEEMYASSRFHTDPEVRDRVTMILQLDPLANITEDEKMSRLTNKGILPETYVISSNIVPFVARAIEEVKGFVDMDLRAKKDLMQKYAQEILTQLEPVDIEPDDTGLDDDGNPIEDAPVQ